MRQVTCCATRLDQRGSEAADHAKRAESLETDAGTARKQADDLLKRAAEFEAAAAQLDGEAQ